MFGKSNKMLLYDSGERNILLYPPETEENLALVLQCWMVYSPYIQWNKKRPSSKCSTALNIPELPKVNPSVGKLQTNSPQKADKEGGVNVHFSGLLTDITCRTSLSYFSTLGRLFLSSLEQGGTFPHFPSLVSKRNCWYYCGCLSHNFIDKLVHYTRLGDSVGVTVVLWVVITVVYLELESYWKEAWFRLWYFHFQ